ncbi:MAG: NADH-quinone oxidoreductase subunit J [Candidatus Omnitrophota bacterium]|nr:NADH-quinone oxidoreductase subunit J [Candidatus Omnitrophota bacterium]
MNGLIQLLNSFLNEFGLYREFIIKASFYFIAALTCLFAFMVVTSRDIFHCAVFLAATLFGVACVYLFLNAEFLAVVQVLIYVGAIVTLFIFAIMLTTKIHDKAIRQTNHQVLIGGALALALLFSLIIIINQDPWKASAAGTTSGYLGLGELGKSLMSTYALPFEVISLILLAALVGAIVIGRTYKE